jgi:hypothetical protein
MNDDHDDDLFDAAALFTLVIVITGLVYFWWRMG